MSIGAEFERLLLDKYKALFHNVDIKGFKYALIIREDPIDAITFIANESSFNYLLFLRLLLT
jgi:hypothetical protein